MFKGVLLSADALLGPILALSPVRGVMAGFLLGSLESCVPRTLCPNLLGAGLPYRGGARCTGVAMEGRPAAICGLRKGDSGRGKDGRDFLNCGLGALPGPRDWLNLGTEGVGGVNDRFMPALEFEVVAEGVVGVMGKESSCIEVELRLVALLSGRNMPAPGFVVWKYETL